MRFSPNPKTLWKHWDVIEKKIKIVPNDDKLIEFKVFKRGSFSL